jgi:FMN phosphatase YigB (HAD superfamily)
MGGAKRMIVSFDLDNTLIPGTKIFAVEKADLLQKLL